jgi:hypothetical protein
MAKSVENDRMWDYETRLVHFWDDGQDSTIGQP